MKSLIKSVLLIASGILISLGLLYGYSVLFKNAAGETSKESLSFVPIEPGDAIISQISGEVYIIREEKTMTPRPGDAVKEGDVIKVVDDSWCQIHIVGKATMRLRSNTLVRVQKLLSNNRDMDFRTELLTGSMIYKVDRLASTDNLEVVAQEKIYKVKGTEFYIEAFSVGGSRVVVREGKVAVLDGTDSQNEALISTVTPGKTLDLRNWNRKDELPELREMDPEEKKIIDLEGPTELFQKRANLVFLDISSMPEGAELYINGRLTGSNTVIGLYPKAEVLKITARKRGYRDSHLEIKPEDLNNSIIQIPLTPLSLDESLKSEKEESLPVSVTGLKAEYEREKAALNSKIEKEQQTIKDLNRQNSQLENDLKDLKKTNSQLQKERSQSLEEQKKLRELLQQIQQLSDQQS